MRLTRCPLCKKFSLSNKETTTEHDEGRWFQCSFCKTRWSRWESKR